MATYYFDSVSGDDSNDGLSELTPWASYQNKFASIAAGDISYIKRGTTQTLTTMYFSFRSGVSAAVPTRTLAYGVGTKPRWVYTGTFWGWAINMSNRSNFIFEDQDFDGSGIQGPIAMSAQGTTNCMNGTFRRCIFHDAGPYSGLSITKASDATTGTCSNHLVDNCEFYNCGEHGFTTSAIDVLVRRCKAYHNGANSVFGGHGFSARWGNVLVTSGWTLVSGNIYKRALTAAESAEGRIGYVKSPITNRRLVSENTSTPTTPGLDEYGLSGSELYINLGQTPNGLSIAYAFHECSGITFDECIAYENYANTQSAYPEGHGIALDGFAENSIVKKCQSFNNEGGGISVAGGSGNTVECCVAYGNGLAGIFVDAGPVCAIERCTIAWNNNGNWITPAPLTDAEEITAQPQATVSVTETVVAATPELTAYCIGDYLANATIDRCSLYGATATKTAIPTNPIIGNPLISESGLPLPTSPAIGAGVHLGYVRDLVGVQRPNPPSIGAYDLPTHRRVLDSDPAGW